MSKINIVYFSIIKKGKMIEVLKVYIDLVTGVKMVTCKGRSSVFDITIDELIEVKKMGFKVVCDEAILICK